jgi:hypothetical protein
MHVLIHSLICIYCIFCFGARCCKLDTLWKIDGAHVQQQQQEEHRYEIRAHLAVATEATQCRPSSSTLPTTQSAFSATSVVSPAARFSANMIATTGAATSNTVTDLEDDGDSDVEF